jgi:hypothetical protein
MSTVIQDQQSGRHRAQRRGLPFSLRPSAAAMWCLAMLVGSIGCVFNVGAVAVPVALVLFGVAAMVPDRSWHR